MGKNSGDTEWYGDCWVGFFFLALNLLAVTSSEEKRGGIEVAVASVHLGMKVLHCSSSRIDS